MNPTSIEPDLAYQPPDEEPEELAPRGEVDPEAVSEALRLLAELFVKPRAPVTIPHLAPVTPHGVSRQRKVEQPEVYRQSKPGSWSNAAHQVGDARVLLVGRNDRRDSCMILNSGATDLLVSATEDVSDRNAFVIAAGATFSLDTTAPVYARAKVAGVVLDVRIVQTFHGEVL